MNITADSFAQDSTSSLAFRENRPRRPTIFYYQPDLSYQIWQQFKLIREANSGDPLAMHELGIRYLIGEGFTADTVKAVEWIGKAANKRLTAAEYNYGLLLNNGWGVDWNPFLAYDYFHDAATAGMPQAEYIFGILNTNSLIVNTNWDLAFKWLKKASDGGFKPAEDVLPEIIKKISPQLRDSIQNASSIPGTTKPETKFDEDPSITSNLGLVFIDFNSNTDSIPVITNKQILESILRNSNQTLSDTLGIDEKNDTLFTITDNALDYVIKSADAGNPEALTLIGRLYETGTHYKKNLLSASFYYVRATILDSPLAPALLWNISKSPDYFNNLKSFVDKNNPEAMYVWYGLYILGFDRQFTDGDALNLLTKAASLNNTQAMVELGLVYYTGKITREDKSKALNIWRNAAQLGNSEGKIRLAAADLLDNKNSRNIREPLQILFNAEDLGSVLAQVALAYCYENAIGVSKSKPAAVKYYRLASQRGSRFAYNELKRLYNEIRPPSFKASN